MKNSGHGLEIFQSFNMAELVCGESEKSVDPDSELPENCDNIFRYLSMKDRVSARKK
jgi:hypothetical protein